MLGRMSFGALVHSPFYYGKKTKTEGWGYIFSIVRIW
jgi:hypothetical protein